MPIGILEQLQRDGYVIIENFLSPEEVDKLRSAGETLTRESPVTDLQSQFNTVNSPQNKDKYFLESGDKIRFFLESGAVGTDGKLCVERSRSLNKVGHALHWLHPEFRSVTFSKSVKEVCYQLGIQEPAVVQSMYIYKNPGVGSEVVAHQDATYLYTEPVKLFGFWIALDDATQQNGCLWFAPGSHNSGVHRRYQRNSDSNSDELVIYDKPAPMYPNSNFRPEPVKRGTCVLIHGQVVHHSEPNRSDSPRHAYTFHVIDEKDSVYAADNWLQPTVELPFPSVYKN